MSSAANAVVFAADPCRFVHPEKGIIDLTTLGRTDGTATYKDIETYVPSFYVYSYNPCKPFTETSACENVAVCQLAKTETYAFTIGTQESISWKEEDVAREMPSAVYEYGGKTSVVYLECSTSEVAHFEAIAEYPINVFIFRLKHKCACWNGCSDTPSTTTAIAPTTTSQAETDACRFVHPEKGVINLSFIGRTDEKAAYSDEITRTTSHFKYSYNPCRSFSQGSGCIGASVCQIANDGKETITLGTQESAWWDTTFDTNAVASLNYVYGDKKVSISLQCSNEGNNEFEAYGESPVNTFRFQLTHKCACWNAC